MNSSQKALANITYITIPAHLGRKIEGFQIDTAKSLPVELADGTADLTNLSWEMIVSGMLKVIAFDRNNKDIDYYRDFVFALRPNIYEELTNTGIIKAEQKDWNLAEEILLAAEGLNEGLTRSTVNLAILYENMAQDYLNKNQHEMALELKQKAKKYYSAALSSSTPLPDAFFNAAFFYLRDNDFQKAKPLLETFLEISRDESKSKAAKIALDNFEKQGLLDNLFKEAYDFIIMGNEDKSLEKIELFLKEYPQVWNAWFIKGWALRRKELYSDAKIAFAAALKFGGQSNVDTLNEMAICHLELEEFDQCQQYLMQALNVDPESVKIISNLGVLALRRGNKEEAKNYFQIVLELEPDDPVALRYLNTIG